MYKILHESDLFTHFHVEEKHCKTNVILKLNTVKTLQPAVGIIIVFTQDF